MKNINFETKSNLKRKSPIGIRLRHREIRILNELVREGKLKRTGADKNAKYFLSCGKRCIHS